MANKKISLLETNNICLQTITAYLETFLSSFSLSFRLSSEQSRALLFISCKETSNLLHQPTNTYTTQYTSNLPRLFISLRFSYRHMKMNYSKGTLGLISNDVTFAEQRPIAIILDQQMSRQFDFIIFSKCGDRWNSAKQMNKTESFSITTRKKLLRTSVRRDNSAGLSLLARTLCVQAEEGEVEKEGDLSRLPVDFTRLIFFKPMNEFTVENERSPVPIQGWSNNFVGVPRVLRSHFFRGRYR